MRSAVTASRRRFSQEFKDELCQKAGLHTVEVRREEIGDPRLREEYAREIAAANMMVQTRTFLAAQRAGG